MADAAAVWAIPARYQLREARLDVLASPWHTDVPIEVVTDMGKSRKLGFLDYQATDDSFSDLFAQLREAKLVP